MANCSFNKVCLGPVHRKAYAPNPPKTAIKFVFLAAVFKNLGLYRFKMVWIETGQCFVTLPWQHKKMRLAVVSSGLFILHFLLSAQPKELEGPRVWSSPTFFPLKTGNFLNFVKTQKCNKKGSSKKPKLQSNKAHTASRCLLQNILEVAKIYMKGLK